MKRLTIGLLVLLAVLHQDFWWWDDGHTLVFGFMPVGLAYHAGVSVAAAGLWALAVRYCWPEHVDSADEPEPTAEPETGGSA